MTNPKFLFAESPYRFTDPIRYFTSSDPYYWEIDNIPLKQLQENDLWLKDQLEDGFKNLRFNTGRSDFQELIPYSDSADNTVKVKPGRYTARINDASHNPRLQELTRLFGKVFDEPNKWRFASYGNEDLKANIDRITSEVANDALFMNGLIERVFTYAVKNPYEAFDEVAYSEAQQWTFHSPLLKIFFWPGSEYGTDQWWQDVTKWNSEYGLRSALLIESLFVKYWRGVFRLSIVDVSETLSIEIPPFNQRDFDYYDEDGVLQQNNSAEIRIDLLFIYSKPIDASATTIKTVEVESSRSITKPELGLVRGAGVILRKNPENFGGYISAEPSIDENGFVKILASPADAVNANSGFLGLNVKGSFPSPDDLMNVAPLLMDDLESSDPRLVGQSVLPIAYIIVRRGATENPFGQAIISNDEIIDIRPFFRTAELAYNERAGIGASVPQISISNPVVSDMKLKYVTNEIIQDYSTKLARLNDQVTRSRGQETNVARVVGGGIIQGGSRFGPEGAIRDYYMTSQGLSRQASLQRLTEVYNMPSNVRAAYYPEWDVAPWVPGTKRKEYPNDCVFVHVHSDYLNGGGGGSNYNYVGKSAAALNGAKLDHLVDNTLFFFCKKTILLDRRSVEWMDHYTVNAQLVNCVPLSHASDLSNPVTAPHAGASNIWIEYQRDQFTIYCAWPGMQNVLTEQRDISRNFLNWLYRFGSSGSLNSTRRDTIYKTLFTTGLVNLRDNAEVTAGFTVLTQELASQNSNKLINAGLSIYPTIKFDIIGYPRAFPGVPVSLYEENPTITLV